MEKFIRKLQKVSSHSYVINIPKEIIQRFGWKERQKLVISFAGQKFQLNIKDWKNNKHK